MTTKERERMEMLLLRYPEHIRQRFWAARDWLIHRCPTLREEVDVKAGLMAFSLGPGYKGMVCTLILSQKGLKLGLPYAASFPDPHAVLKGGGKVHRHVILPPDGPDAVAGLEHLFQCAVQGCRR